jgi:hemerythrin
MAILWTERLAVGHETIDAQHRELFARFGDLLEACKQNRGKEKLSLLFSFLEDYVGSHFDEEERLMAAKAYPDLGAHREQHRIFIDRLQDLGKLLRKDGPSLHVLVDTNHVLLDWIINHIKGVDVQLGAYLRGQS